MLAPSDLCEMSRKAAINLKRPPYRQLHPYEKPRRRINPLYTKVDTMTSPKDRVLSSPKWVKPRRSRRKIKARVPPLVDDQTQTPSWKRVTANIAVGDARKILSWKKKHLERSICGCTTTCDEICLNRLLLYECDSQNCKFGDEWCSNREFQDLEQRECDGVRVEVFETENRGSGLRSKQVFKPNQLIIEYTGEIITPQEHKRRGNGSDGYRRFVMKYSDGLLLDATKKGSLARFTNHACIPSCRVETWTVKGQIRMGLFASARGLDTGQELTFAYGLGKDDGKCKCGAKECQGFLGKHIRTAVQ